MAGLCHCHLGFRGLSCDTKVACRFWDPTREEWSSEGCESRVTATALICSCTHLTEFGGLSLPASPDALLEEFSSIEFNTFTLDEAAAVLGDFDFAANPTIYVTVFILSGLNALTLLFGFWRERRRRFTRLREGRGHEEEGQAEELKQLSRAVRDRGRAALRTKEGGDRNLVDLARPNLLWSKLQRISEQCEQRYAVHAPSRRNGSLDFDLARFSSLSGFDGVGPGVPTRASNFNDAASTNWKRKSLCGGRAFIAAGESTKTFAGRWATLRQAKEAGGGSGEVGGVGDGGGAVGGVGDGGSGCSSQQYGVADVKDGAASEEVARVSAGASEACGTSASERLAVELDRRKRREVAPGCHLLHVTAPVRRNSGLLTATRVSAAQRTATATTAAAAAAPGAWRTLRLANSFASRGGDGTAAAPHSVARATAAAAGERKAVAAVTPDHAADGLIQERMLVVRRSALPPALRHPTTRATSAAATPASSSEELEAAAEAESMQEVEVEQLRGMRGQAALSTPDKSQGRANLGCGASASGFAFVAAAHKVTLSEQGFERPRPDEGGPANTRRGNSSVTLLSGFPSPSGHALKLAARLSSNRGAEDPDGPIQERLRIPARGAAPAPGTTPLPSLAPPLAPSLAPPPPELATTTATDWCISLLTYPPTHPPMYLFSSFLAAWMRLEIGMRHAMYHAMHNAMSHVTPIVTILTLGARRFLTDLKQSLVVPPDQSQS